MGQSDTTGTERNETASDGGILGCMNVSTVTDFLLKLALLVNSVHEAKVLFFKSR